MSVPSFSSLAGLEVAEKFEVVGRGDRFQLASVSNINPSYFELL